MELSENPVAAFLYFLSAVEKQANIGVTFLIIVSCISSCVSQCNMLELSLHQQSVSFGGHK